jgi:hypothetical protein
MKHARRLPEPKNDTRDLTKNTDITHGVTKALVTIGGGLYTLLSGDPVTGTVISGSADAAATAAGRVHCAINQTLARRLEESGDRIQQRLQVAGVQPDREILEDLLLKTADLLAAAEAPKRQLIENVIVNVAKRANCSVDTQVMLEALKADAAHAIQKISDLPPHAAVYFAALRTAREWKDTGDNIYLRVDQPTVRGLSIIAQRDAVQALNLATLLQTSHPLENGLAAIMLNDVGQWLLTWTDPGVDEAAEQDSEQEARPSEW